MTHADPDQPNAYDPDKLTDPEYEEIFGEPRLRRKKKSESEKKRDKMKENFNKLSDEEKLEILEELTNEDNDS